MAARFEHVFALDVSPTMLRRLGEYCERHRVTNVTPILATDWRPDETRVDLVYSRLVLQHLESLEEIGRYLTGAATSIEDGGLAYLQFDTRPQTLPYRVKTVAPDWMLPSHWRRGIRRIRRSPAELHALFERAGLSVVDELRPGSADHVFVLGR
jgi:cyclopropane fatty-acyl-phospholipid synthase-like methyltransferase